MSRQEYPSNPNLIENIKGLPNLLENLADQYIVRPTGQDSNVKGVSGFVFDVIGDEAMSLESAITDHYVEENYAVQDHIALRPERFTLMGYVGELTDIFQTGALSILTKVQGIGTLGGLLPDFSQQATELYGKIAATASKVGTIVNQARNIYDLALSRGTSSTKQYGAYLYFYGLWRDRILCEVETPFGVLKSMAIESVQVRQGEASRHMSDFVITFKKIRTTKTIQFKVVASPGRAKSLLTKPVNIGETSGLQVSNTFLRQVFPRQVSL